MIALDFQYSHVSIDDIILLYPEFFSKDKADFYFDNLKTNLQWEQKNVIIYGNEHKQPRLTAWYGDKDAAYTYSGLKNEPLPWTTSLLEIKEAIEKVNPENPFNSVLANYYRDGKDSIGWHSDNERELGKQPLIASVSFGEERPFLIRHKNNHKAGKCITLPHGSLLIMKGKCQQYWQHSVPKSKYEIGSRINLTFRKIFT